MISVAAQEMPLVSDRMRLAAEALGRLGWDLRSVEIDLVAGRARIVLARDHDGRLVTLDADRGRVSVTREEMVVTHTTVGRRGDRCPVERVSYRLLGRERFPGGVRAGLRYLANYLDDNSPSFDTLASARGALRLLLADGAAP